MLACCSDAAVRISRSNRSALMPAASSGERTLTTTLRPSRISSATKTRDVPTISSGVFARERRMATDKGYQQREENPHQGFGSTGATTTDARAETKSSRGDQERAVQTGREETRSTGVSRRSTTTPVYD